MTVENDDRLRSDLLQRRLDDLLQASSPSENRHASKSARFRLMILAPLALFLVWEVITRSVAAYLADAWPEMAIRLRSTNPTALLNLADEALDRTADARKQAEPQ